MPFTIHPATGARFPDVSTILAPKKAGAQGCWCLSYRLSPKQNDALRAPHRAEEVQRLCRRRSHAPGVLAYDSGEVVGWAAIAPREELVGFDPRRFPADQPGVWVLYCFRVRAGRGGQGVSRALLDGAVGYAHDQGRRLSRRTPSMPVGNGSTGRRLWRACWSGSRTRGSR